VKVVAIKKLDFTFLVPAYPGCPGKEAIKWVVVVVVVMFLECFYSKNKKH